MRKKLQLDFKTLFSRILFFNLIMVIIVSIMPQGIFFSYFRNIYDDEVEKNNMQKVKQTQKYIDELILEKVVNIPNSYLSEIKENDDLVYPLYYNIRDDVNRIRNISERLNGIKLIMPFVETIEIYYAKSNIVFYNSRVCFLDEKGTSKGFDSTWLNILKNSDANVRWSTRKDANSIGNTSEAVFVRSIPYFTSKENRQAIITVSINNDALYDNIENIKFNDEGNFLIVSEDGGIIVDNTLKVPENSEKYGQLIQRVLAMGDEGHYEDRIDNKLSVVSFAKSEMSGWRYISISSIDDFYQKSRQLNGFLLIAGLFILLVNVIISVLISRTAYKPIGGIISAVKGLSGIFNSNEDMHDGSEYKLLSNTINDIAFKIHDLNNKLEISKPVIRYNAILKLIKGRVSSKGDINANKELFDIQFNKDRFFCFIIKVYNDKNLSFENKMLIYYNLCDLLESSSKVFDIRAIIDDRDNLIGIVNFSSGLDRGEMMMEIQSSIESLISVPYTICAGNSYSLGQEEISASYGQALECIKYTFFRTKEKVLYYVDLNTDLLKETGSSLKLMGKVEECMRAGDMDRLMFIIDGIIESIITGGYTIDYCKNSMMDLVSTIRRTVITLGYDENDLFGYDIREYFKQIGNIDEFRDWIHNVAVHALMKIDVKKQELSIDLEEKIKVNIMNNICNDLSVDKVAEIMALSPYQLNKIVKAASGKNFIDYVTEIKLEYAAKLLLDGKFTVKDIANKLGYNSVQYFIRIFKGRYGDTPKEYQKKSRAEGN